MEGQSLLVPNLLNDVDALGRLLGEAVRTGCWLDAYLIAAGLNQVAEDHVHSSPYPFDAASSFLGESSAGANRCLARAASVCGQWTRAALGSRQCARELRGWQYRLARLVDELAAVVAGGRMPEEKLGARCSSIVDEIETLPRGVRRSVLRLPACFHGFDQHPEDIDRLAARYLERRPRRDRPLLVVGVRTSGSYLAPLLAAFLRAQGHRVADVITVRPQQALLTDELALLSTTIAADGEVLLTDDPPVSGAALAQVARMLERAGVAPERIVVVLGLMREPSPAPIDGYRKVLLGPSEWVVDRRLQSAGVRSSLVSLLSEELEVEAIEPLALPPASSWRGHRRSLWRVRGRDLHTGMTHQLDVLVSGVGLGYFGGQALAVARRLSAFSPRVLGLHRGLLYREWLPADRCLDRADPSALAATVAQYVDARRKAMPLGRDPSLALRGERPVWEVAGVILSDRFGRGAPVARFAFVDALARRLLSVARPSVVDGATSPERWFASGRGQQRALKTGLTAHTHWRLGLACSDAAFDLAGAGALGASGSLSDSIRRAWRELTGEEVSAERWLLYELAHLWGVQKAHPDREGDVGHAAARALQRYFAGAFLSGIERSADGPLVALDIDGVLETELLGWPSLTRASAVALRALGAHGYRPVLVSGRGLDEVRGRCRTYGLAGGVAEYGSAVYLTVADRAISRVDRNHAAALERLRSVLDEENNIRFDMGCRHSLRAYRLGRHETRQPLCAAEISSALTRSGTAGAILAIAGEGQTDFIPAAIDKGGGLQALAAQLGGRCSQVALAVGDSLPDRPMLRLAQIAAVPAHAPRGIADRPVRRVKRPYQAGLELTVARFLGHRPGNCPLCRLPDPGLERTAVVGLLSIAERGRWGIPWESVRLLARLSMAAGRD